MVVFLSLNYTSESQIWRKENPLCIYACSNIESLTFSAFEFFDNGFEKHFPFLEKKY